MRRPSTLRHGLPCALLLWSALAAAGVPAPEPGESLPGGDATYTGPRDRNAFSHRAAGLAPEQAMDFHLGKALFERLWATAPASTQAADGLGPLYNARSCAQCHRRDGRGRAPRADGNALSLVLHLSVPPRGAAQRAALAEGRLRAIPDPVYGAQLQDRAIAGHAPEGRVAVSYTETTQVLRGGDVVALRRPDYRIEDAGYGRLSAELMTSPRLAPPMLGLGLLEAIPAARILAAADPDDADGDGISGRANRVWSPSHRQVMLGRFGWKAGSADVDDQSQAAFANDIGIGTPLHPDPAGDCSVAQTACRAAPSGNSPQYDDLEAHAQITDLVALYARNLAVPARPDAAAPEVLAGKALFAEAGCAACHTPSHPVGEQRIWPYTDLLLHDMGEGLADHRPEGDASGREWRTPPLWGIGLTETVSGAAFYLHDGRARNLLEAIMWHGGEAAPARDAVARMTPAQRRTLLRFLASL